jgi:hypothetical protein
VTNGAGDIVSTITSDAEAVGTKVTSVGGSLVTEVRQFDRLFRANISLTGLKATNAAGSVVSTVTNAANTDTSNGAAVATAAPVIAGGLLGAGVAMVALL